MGKKGRRINMVVCDESKASVLVKCFCPEEGELPMFEPGALLAISEARVEWFNGSVSCSCGMAQCELEPQVPAATPLRAWWQTRPAGDPPPMVSTVTSCIPLGALSDAWARGEEVVDVLGVVHGSINAKTLASGEVVDVFDLMDRTASMAAQIGRSGTHAQHSYVDGTVLAIKEAKLVAAADGRITLVAPEANVKLWPRAQQARELNDFAACGHGGRGSC